MAAGRLYLGKELESKGAFAIGCKKAGNEAVRFFLPDHNYEATTYYLHAGETIHGMFGEKLLKALENRRSKKDTSVSVTKVLSYYYGLKADPQVHVVVPSDDFRKGPPYILDEIIPEMLFRGRHVILPDDLEVRSQQALQTVNDKECDGEEDPKGKQPELTSAVHRSSDGEEDSKGKQPELTSAVHRSSDGEEDSKGKQPELTSAVDHSSERKLNTSSLLGPSRNPRTKKAKPTRTKDVKRRK